MERDITGRVAERTRLRLSKFNKHWNQKIMPYGPAGVGLTDQEARLKLQAVDPAVKANFIRQVGDDEWRSMMQDLYGGKA